MKQEGTENLDKHFPTILIAKISIPFIHLKNDSEKFFVFLDLNPQIKSLLLKTAVVPNGLIERISKRLPDLEEFILLSGSGPDRTDIINLAEFKKLNSFHMYKPVILEDKKRKTGYPYEMRPYPIEKLVEILINGSVPIESLSLQCFYKRGFIENLVELGTLRKLELTYCFITPEELIYLIEKLKRLEILRIHISEKSRLYIKINIFENIVNAIKRPKRICSKLRIECCSNCHLSVPPHLIKKNKRWLEFSNSEEFCLYRCSIDDDD